jgi:transposase
MKVTLVEPSDRIELQQRVRTETNAKQRDRWRAVLLAAEGDNGVELLREQIAGRLGRSRQFVDEWVKRYRRGGIEALRPKKQPGHKPRLSDTQQQELMATLDAGPPEEQGKSTFTGQDIRQHIEQHFGVLYSLNGVYELLHRLGYSWLSPRPRHPQSDAAAQEAFKKTSSRRSRRCRPIIPASVC